MTVRHRVFARMLGVAVVSHLAGNWRYGDVWPEPSAIGTLLAVAGLLATAAIVAPRRWMLLVLGVVVPATVVLELPVLGNHWLLTGFVCLTYLVTWGRWDRFAPAARLILLVAYAFAAFSKLNTGFLDPVTSCGLFYFNEFVGELGLGPVSPSSPMGWGAAWGSALVELSIPVLLVIRRTRYLGVMVGIVFHGLMSLDLAQHFYAFSSILLALFILFLDDEFSERFESLAGKVRPSLRRVLGAAVAGVGFLVTLFNVTPLTERGLWFLMHGSFIWWIPYLALVVWAAAGARERTALDWRLAPTTAVVVALVVVNGLTPYLELKTATSWNMYANLVTVDGQSNHLLVRSTWPLRDGQHDLVAIVASDDPGLQEYADQDYLLPWPSFRAYLTAHPDISVTYERGGTTVEVEEVGENPILAEPVPWWWRWMPLRSVHATTPDQCQVGYLPAM